MSLRMKEMQTTVTEYMLHLIDRIHLATCQNCVMKLGIYPKIYPNSVERFEFEVRISNIQEFSPYLK
jgi:hypothetical protein